MRRAVVGIVAAIAVIAAAAVAGALFFSPQAVAPEVEQMPEPAVREAAPEQSTVTEEEEPEPELVSLAEQPSATAQTESGLTVTAPELFLQTDELAAVEQAVADLEAQGHEVALVLTDLETGRGLTYNADSKMYPASCIKAAYCTYVLETRGSAGGMSSTVAECLIDSSNDAYHDLLDAFGLTAFESWLQQHGGPAPILSSMQRYYPNMTASELAAFWGEIYRFGTSGEAGAAELTSLLAQTNYSPLGALLRESCTVWAKPGWYYADGAGLEASNDAGVVFSESGAYLVVVMTDVSSDLEAIKPLISALDEAHAMMCAGSVEVEAE